MAWDNTIPADNTRWDVAAGEIRDNWDFMETKWGVDLVNAGAVENVYNVTTPTYGAVGDGVVDDSSAIQAAIDAANSAGGGVVFLPEGSYKLLASLILKSNIILRGESGSIITFTGITSINTTSAVTKVTIERLIFDGNSAASSKAILLESGDSFVIIQDCEIKNCGASGLDGESIQVLNGATNVTVRRNHVHNCRRGINMANSSNLFFIDNRIYDIGPGSGAGETGIFVWGTSTASGDETIENVIIRGNHVKNIGDNGIRITSQSLVDDADTGTVKYVTITNNIVEQVGRDCYRVQADDLSIVGNIAIDPDRAGISSAGGGDNISICGNIIKTVTTRPSNIAAGIRWELETAVTQSRSSNVVISGNSITGKEFEAGIFCFGVTGVQASNLIISNNVIKTIATDTTGTPLGGIVVQRYDDAMILNNLVDNATIYGISMSDSSNGIIRGNKVINCDESGSDIALRTLAVTNCIVEDNDVRGNDVNYNFDFLDTMGPYTPRCISTRTGIDLDGANGTESQIYTVPTEKTLVVTHVIMREFSAAVTASVVTFGRNGGDADEFLGNQTLTGITANFADEFLILMPVPSSTPVVIEKFNAADIFVMEITTKEGSALTATVDVFGYLV